jgi:hypothetical protein
MMRGHKPAEGAAAKYTVAEDWPWTHPTYELVIDKSMDMIQEVVIDPTRRMADIDTDNNAMKVN